MKLNVLSLKGDVKEEIEAPKAFAEEVRRDLILRAVRSELSKTYQPKGVYRWAGLQTSADYIGNKDKYRTMKNRGAAMLPHEKLPKGRYGRVRIIPFAVTGRRAHPPKPEKVLVEKINKKEWQKALRSAIAASAHPEIVKERTGDEYKVPYIFEDAIESLEKTKDVVSFLKTVGLYGDVEKSHNSRKRITGLRRKRKVRAVRVRKSILFVVSDDSPLVKGAGNLPGVKVVKVSDLTVNDVAPGGFPGRLVVWSKSAVQKLGEMYGNN